MRGRTPTLSFMDGGCNVEAMYDITGELVAEIAGGSRTSADLGLLRAKQFGPF